MKEVKTARVFVRMTAEEHHKFLSLGGSTWLREKIKKAKMNGVKK